MINIRCKQLRNSIKNIKMFDYFLNTSNLKLISNMIFNLKVTEMWSELLNANVHDDFCLI